MARKALENAPIPIQIKLSLLWASLMSLYIYNDYLVLYTPGMIEMMSAGSLGPLGVVTDLKMVLVAIVMATPASMVFLSSTLPASLSRSLNLILGPIYFVMACLTLIGSPPFYKLIVGFQIIALALIFWLALRWPKHTAQA